VLLNKEADRTLSHSPQGLANLVKQKMQRSTRNVASGHIGAMIYANWEPKEPLGKQKCQKHKILSNINMEIQLYWYKHKAGSVTYSIHCDSIITRTPS